MAQALRKIGSLVFGNGLMVPSSRARAHGGVVAPAKLSASGDVARCCAGRDTSKCSGSGTPEKPSSSDSQRLAVILEMKVLSFGAGEC